VATVHLIHGYLCSGKTTFARQLEERLGGVRYSLDEWVTALTHDPVHLDDELYERLYALAMDLWPRIADLGDDVILDFGFWSRRRRDEALYQVTASGHRPRLYSVVCPDEVARSRCRERNAQASSDYRISETAYDELRGKFEPLGTDEPADIVDCRDLSHPTSSGTSR
jgi:predicted kinase